MLHGGICVRGEWPTVAQQGMRIIVSSVFGHLFCRTEQVAMARYVLYCISAVVCKWSRTRTHDAACISCHTDTTHGRNYILSSYAYDLCIFNLVFRVRSAFCQMSL